MSVEFGKDPKGISRYELKELEFRATLNPTYMTLLEMVKKRDDEVKRYFQKMEANKNGLKGA
jgi:hypothetical protein